MIKKLLIIFIVPFALLCGITSCKNDNDGFREYYHPMGNNPVQVIPWLKDVRKSFLQKEAHISEYTYNDTKYYLAQEIIKKEPATTSPLTIYEANEKQKVIFFHTDDSLVSSEQDSIYMDFADKADFVAILWSNEARLSVDGGILN